MWRKIWSWLIIAPAMAVLLSGARTWGDDGFYVIPARGTQGPPGASLNPLQIATLRWYEASINGNFYFVGANPTAIAFDGANIWVANSADNYICKR
jgi:hypothetical protein